MRDRDFLTYWTSQTAYGVGLPIAALAIPILAVSTLHAGPVEMGYLGAASTVAFLVLGLPAGVIVDRTRRLPLMIGLNFFGIAVLALIPIASAVGMLRMELLYASDFLLGGVGVIWQVASQAFLPSLVGRPRLVEANSRMQLGYSAGQVAGPGVGGVLIQAVSAPFAIVVTLISQLVGTILMVTIRADEPPPHVRARRSVLAEVREGLDLVFADRNIRSIMLCGTVHNIFSNGMLVALYVLFATRELGITPAQLGIVFAAAGPGAILGSLLATSLPRAVGLGPAIGAMQVFTGVARLAMPLAALAAAVVPPFLVLALGELVLAIVRTIFNVNQLSLRQAITPDHQQGRMNASIRFVMWAVVPFGALLGGWLGDRIGLLPTLWIGVAGTFLASLWIFLTPVRSLREAPEAVPA
jgi:MFS family permease